MRLRLSAIIVSAALAIAGGAPADFTPTPLTPAQAMEDIRLLRETLERVHPGLTRYATEGEMDALFAALERRAAGGTTEFDLYRDVMLLLAAIRCDHTKAELPETIATFRREQATFIPLAWRAIENRLFITEVASDISGLEPGDEVLSINGAPTAGVLRLVGECIPVDGWTDHVKAHQMGGNSEWMGDSIGHALPFFYGFASSFTLTVHAGDDAPIRTITLDPVAYEAWLDINTPAGARYRNFDDADSVVSEILPGNVGYLRVDTFVNYRTNANPREVLEPHFASFRDAGCTTVILDLRNCGGGSDEVPRAIMRYFADRPFVEAKQPNRVMTYDFDGLRNHLSTWTPGALNPRPERFTQLDNGMYEMEPIGGPRAFRPIEPYDDRFAGDLIVLVGPANASGATNFSVRLREFRDRLQFVGEPTGGSAEGPTAGLLFYLDLPNSGIRVRVPYYLQFNNTSEFTPGMGIAPDVFVPTTVADFRSGRDAALERALELARR